MTAPPDLDDNFWQDWWRNWLLYGTVYAINNPEPRVVDADTLTIHEGPCPTELESVPTPPKGLLPVRALGEHEIEAAGGWVVACGSYGEYGCMPTGIRDYIVATLNRAAQGAIPSSELAAELERRGELVVVPRSSRAAQGAAAPPDLDLKTLSDACRAVAGGWVDDSQERGHFSPVVLSSRIAAEYSRRLSGAPTDSTEDK